MFYEVILQHVPQIETKDGATKDGKPVKEKYFIANAMSTIEAETVAIKQFGVGLDNVRAVSVKELPAYRDVFVLDPRNSSTLD